MKGKWAHKERQKAYSALRKDIEAGNLQREQNFKDSIPKSLKSGKRLKELRIKAVLEMIEKLKPGDCLACFGVPNAIIKKVNRKSITDTNGERWRIEELSPVPEARLKICDE